ncbi:PREDICTED: GATA transcription factor 5-like isoform X2 [Ipomoea nil]|uniref:GATA transcription factor 5-like isoform X2 n=1 Tax=Ipomoea nil TaxID=35883 RepID=UPI0009008CF4|nr:PREDICTED: GATA transcription factor 5-like isoform X2 [Ipomoea nil]
MLYPTSHHSHFSPLSSLSLLPPPPHPPSSPLKAVMECVELGSFLRPQAALKMIHQQGYLENEFAAAAGNGQGGVAAISGDDLFVDQLLNLSNEFVEAEAEKEEEKVEEKRVENLSVTLVSASPQKEAETVTFPVTDDFAGSIPGSELSVPADDLDNLEWLSHFVEASFSDEYSLTCPAGKLLPLPSEENNHLSRSEIPVQGKPGFISPVQTKARTKRARTGVRVWPVGAPPSFTESSVSSSSSSSSSSTTTLSSSPTNRWFAQCNSGQLIGKPVAKKPGMQSAQQSRRCSHCGVQKTPQWRAGPLGAKTLCNACGVRFKSGRLLPEYRPACSPTFSRELHSNNHRKVLEMRRQKEAETEPGLASPVQSF